MTSGDLVVAGIIGTILFLVIWKMWHDHKKGNSCAGCPYAGSCPHQLQAGSSADKPDCSH